MKKYWLLPFLVFVPVLFLFLGNYWGAVRSGEVPSGSIQHDQFSYMAWAKGYFSDGTAHLTTGNPYSADPATPRLFFQPMFLLLGALEHWTGTDPMLLYNLFGWLCGLILCFVAFSLLRKLNKGVQDWRLALAYVCFLWGGGAFVLRNLPSFLYRHGRIADLFWLDPSAGWWFQNLGRNLVYSTETFYHLVVILIAYFVYEKKLRPVLALLFLLALSHPLTGIQFLSIVLCWSLFERLIHKNNSVSWYVVLGVAAITAGHLYYYMIFLPSDPEHHSVVNQWRVLWTISLQGFVLANLWVGLLVIGRLCTKARLREVFQDPFNRFLLIWCLMSFVLAKHEWFMSPHQPVHFTRGYTWIALYLLGFPFLISLFDRVFVVFSRRTAVLSLILITVVFLSDNIVWMSYFTINPFKLNFSRSEKELISYLRVHGRPSDLFVSRRDHLSYSIVTYAPVRTWPGHWQITPFVEDKKNSLKEFFKKGIIPEKWNGRRVMLALTSQESIHPNLSGYACQMRSVYNNDDFKLIQWELKKEIPCPAS